MKNTGPVEVESVLDVRCDVCSTSTHFEKSGYQFGTLQAHWGYGTAHDGKRYEIHLCEGCFFQALAYLKQERRIQNMFSTDATEPSSDLGLVATYNFFKESGH